LTLDSVQHHGDSDLLEVEAAKKPPYTDTSLSQGSSAVLKYSSLLEGLRAVGQVKGWQTQQIVFVGGTCGSVHVESFNTNMKALGVLESKWNPIRQKLVRRLLEEQEK
jgi:hypothetical protein